MTDPGAQSVAVFAKKAGVYSVRIKNGSCYSDATNFTLTTIPAPAAPTITGNTLVCIGDSLKLQSSPGTKYQWYIGNSSITEGTNQQFFARTAGPYTVKITDANNCTAASNIFEVTSKPKPTPINFVAIGGICTGDSMALSVGAGSIDSFQWYKNHVAIPGATNQVYYIKDAGPYTVTISKAGCTSAESNNVSPTIFSLPAKPVITSGGTSLSATAGFTSYVWYLNNVIIPGATGNVYNSTKNGIYKVTVQDANGCKNTSADFNFVTTGLNEVNFEGYNVQLYPNPVIDELTIQVKQTLNINGSVSLVVLDGMGKNIQSQTLQPGSNTISLKSLAPGIYMVMLKKGHTEKSVRILRLP